MDLEGKVIVITGAAQGLGRQFALDCAAEGARVALVDRSPEPLEATRAELENSGAEVRAYTVDVSQEEEVVSLYEQVVQDFGGLDASIQNAGILRDSLLVKEKDGQIRKFPLDKWQSVIDINLTGVFLCGREAAAQMIRLKRPGVLINISSIARHGNFGQSNYSAAKAGVAAMAVLWAKELAPYGIRAAAVAPGFTATEMVVSLKEEVKAIFTEQVPLKRFAETREISDGVLFILKNDYFTGEIIEISGGARI
ncbi:MAG: SDR family NAD(P)-dependent oxidoreductase [bacterium]|jgi:3-oxoacyl-[acyl-carrier protein] reductase